MNPISLRELRTIGAEVIDRVVGGESFIVMRNGVPVAELAPLPRRSAPPGELVSRRRALPLVEPLRFRRDVDFELNPSLQVP